MEAVERVVRGDLERPDSREGIEAGEVREEGRVV